MSCHTLLACRNSAERSSVNLIGIPLYVICCFSLVAFNIFSLYLIFDSVINMCLGVFLLGFFLYGTLCASWTWLTISFQVCNYNLLKYFLRSFLFLFFFWDPYNLNVGTFNVVQEVSEPQMIMMLNHQFLLFKTRVSRYTDFWVLGFNVYLFPELFLKWMFWFLNVW